MAFRAFYALPVENFTTRSGLATNAIHGFLSMLVKLLADEEPTHVAIAFDVGRQTFRTEEYAEYKGTRDALPEDFRDQVPLIRETIRAMGLVEVSKENYEADDVIATLAREATGAGMDVLIVSGDRDTFQLVDDAVTVLYPIRGVSTLTRMTPDAVEEKYGVRPGRYPNSPPSWARPPTTSPACPAWARRRRPSGSASTADWTASSQRSTRCPAGPVSRCAPTSPTSCATVA